MDNKEHAQPGCCRGANEQAPKPVQDSCCAGPAGDEKNINLNAACCSPSSPGLAKVRFFILGFFILAALIVLIYGTMHK